MKKSNVAKYAYLAGTIDSDGSIMLVRQPSKKITLDFDNLKVPVRYIPRISVGSIDLRNLKYIHGAVGGKLNIVTIIKKNGECWQKYPLYDWSIGSKAKNLKHLLKNLIPFLKIKKRKAQLLLQYLEIRKENTGKRTFVYNENGNRSRYTIHELKKIDVIYQQMLKETKNIVAPAFVQPQRLSEMTFTKKVN